MGIKSQQDIKNETRLKSEKIPASMDKPTDNPVLNPVPDFNARIMAIESYLEKVDQAFEKVATEINNFKGLLKLIQSMDAEISKLTGDVVRLTNLEENRYIELATAINRANEKLTTLDEYIPVFIDKRLDEYFTESSEETSNYGDLTEPITTEPTT